MPHCIISMYWKFNRSEHRHELPTHVTITGLEDHFGEAAKDADMLLRGMREAINLIKWDDDVKPVFSLKQVSL